MSESTASHNDNSADNSADTSAQLPPLNSVEGIDDPRRPLQRAVSFGWKGLVAITIVSLAIWGGVAGLPGIWGVLIGAAIGGAFVLMTAASVLFTSNTTSNTTLAVVFGGWLLKLVLLIIVMAAIRDLEFYHHVALFITVVAVLVVVLASEVWGVMTSQMSNVF
ncbi:hypothetical protein HMPREF3227_00105 [Corynebacterium sp. CMW7794]|uniref:hypothetical protein n=1 Tax=Corynebacterium sp. CMW7794 TaxID=1603887 RepID=UPI0007934B4B|nr:hypothetical protein HMPREF3227_00105 [Corynebacterium sp. CMW7794]